MKNYKIELAYQVYVSLDTIYKHKNKYDKNSAIDFVSGFFDEVKRLSYLPHRGTNKPNNNRALIYKKHFIIYHIHEPDKISVLDIIDPKQDTVASKYY